MPCKKCQETPGYHSFAKFGKIGDVNLFYTAPAKTLDFNEDGTKLANIKIHIEEETEKKPWILVLDCGNMGIKHYTDISFSAGLLGLLANDPFLESIWVMRSNIWIRTTASFLKTISSAKILNNVKYFDKKGLELFDMLEKNYLDSSTIDWLMKQ
jgi:hypothetical protein